MTTVLVTGMSGTGKSTVLAELARRGHWVVDTDYGDWSEDVPGAGDAEPERRWREDRMDALLAECPAGNIRAIEPLLRAGATAEIDTRRPVDEVVDMLESIAGKAVSSPAP